MRLLLILLISLSSVASQAAPYYKYKDRNGDIIYSDTPPYAGAVPLNAPALPTFPAVKPKPKASPEPAIEDTETKYLSLSIFQPANDESIRSNEGTVAITIKLIPELSTREGHYINIYLDGKLVKKKSASLNITLNDIDRGSHKIKAEVRNKKGKRLKASTSSIFHLHRFSKLHKKKKKKQKKAPPPPAT